MPKKINFNEIKNKKFNRLTLLKETEPQTDNGGYKARMALCRCECGKEKIIRIVYVLSGHTQSCGCYHSERSSEVYSKINFKHGGTRTPEFSCWSAMLDRCYNPNTVSYKRYGGSGIKICERWKNSFENFLADMGKRPSLKHTVDRFPNQKGNYEPSNCRWATKKQQSRNTSTNKIIEFNGEKKCASEWAEIFNISVANVYERIKAGKPIDKLFIPVKKYNLKKNQRGTSTAVY